MLTGENSIIKRTGKAKEETEIASEKEQIQLAVTESLINGMGEIKKDILIETLKNNNFNVISEGENKNLIDIDNGWEFSKDYKKSYIISTEGSINEKEIPFKYKKCKYIESIVLEGYESEYAKYLIDTGVRVKQEHTKINIKFKIIPQPRKVFGIFCNLKPGKSKNIYDAATNGLCGYFGFFRGGYGDKDLGYNTNLLDTNIINEIEYSWKDKHIYNKTLNKKKDLSEFEYVDTSDSTLVLFTRQYGTQCTTTDIKIYEATIYEDEEEIMNLVPCLNAENIPCMYDTVSKKDFLNSGVCEFSYEIE